MEPREELYELHYPAPELAGEQGGPVLIHALEGFTDAGHAVRIAATHLRDSLEATPLATFDIDDLLDYRSRRPTMVFKTDHFESYAEPELTLYSVKDAAGTPFLLLTGLEPDLRWERFVKAVRALSERFGVRRTIGLSAIPMAIPHTRPLGITGHASNAEILGDYQPWIGEVQVPGSASALLEFRTGQAGAESVGFSVHVPHYLAQTDYPEAAQTLLEHVATNARLEFPLAALTEAAARVREQVAEHLEANEEVASVVTALERQYDTFIAAQEKRSSLLAEGVELPSGDEIGAEFEKFLAEQGGWGQADGDDRPHK